MQRVQQQNEFNCYVTIMTKVTMANAIKVRPDIKRRIGASKREKKKLLLVNLLKPHTKSTVVRSCFNNSNF